MSEDPPRRPLRSGPVEPRDFLATPARQAKTLEEVGHRPWPPQDAPWVMGQTWDDLLFAHWRLAPEALGRHVPSSLPLDTFDGAAWLGITPFRVAGLRVRGTPPVPILSSFPELNVRTYVTVDGNPGILFFSLDAASAFAVAAARRSYKLPYFWARMSAARRGSGIEYASQRRGVARGDFAFRARYEPTGEVFTAEPGSLEYFLAERYCLYTLDEAGRILRADIHHPPWPLQEAVAEIEWNTMPPRGLELGGEGPLLHFGRRQDVVIWRAKPLREADADVRD